jgi:plastocyanin
MSRLVTSRTVLVLLIIGLSVPVASSQSSQPSEPGSAVIEIRARQFTPERLELKQGQKTQLIVHNHDAELHAFVPGELLKGVNLNVGGNGAPEFGDQGLKRVIIPPEGRTEISFTPELTGEFSYICDMPGHVMKATIVVK